MNTITDATCTSQEAPEIFDAAFKLLGDFWTLRLIDVLRGQELRFAEIERSLQCCNPVTLTSRLKKLEEAGVLVRHAKTRDKQSVTYALTDKGLDILPVLESMKTFIRKHGQPGSCVQPAPGADL